MDADAVGGLGLDPGLVGFGKEAAGIEGRDLDPRARELRQGDGMGQHLILDAQARGEDQPTRHLAGDQIQPGREIEGGEADGEFAGLRSAALGIRQ